MKRLLDFDEETFFEEYPDLYDLLLVDRTTGKNIKFCSNDYIDYGKSFSFFSEITKESISGKNNTVIKPRVKKNKEFQKNRSRDLGEVFTPAYICNHQNNLLDSEWFEEGGSFNIEDKKTWKSNPQLVFKKGKTWRKYVSDLRLEITCGEGPYLTSRYDATTGFYIGIKERIGIVDRKLRIVSENINDEQTWLKYCKIAYQSSYGYDYQGDNVLLARSSLTYSFIENYYFKFKKFPTIEAVKDIMNILSWNIWQMDGIKNCVPTEKKKTKDTLVFCKIMDWENNNILLFNDIERN